MIRTLEQAHNIQDQRANSGKRGYAKAVRRYLKRDHKDTYTFKKSGFTVSWRKPKQKNKPEKVKSIDLSEVDDA